AKSIDFAHAGMPTTESGSLNMTVVSIASAFGGSGNINDNYHSASFDKFVQNLPIIQQRIEQRYAGATYPTTAENGLAGQVYDPANGGVNLYSADVMIPAFLAAYCGGDAGSYSLDIFPTLKRLMPNWKITYSGLSKLPWFANHFKSFNINHAYKSIFTIGAYNSYTNYMSSIGGMGFIKDVTTGNPVPSSMYNVSTVSINEQFSPLIGVDMTFNSGLTAKAEFKKTRVLNLSMTSVALTENFSDDIVIGFGYKIKDLNLFGAKNIQNPDRAKNKKKNRKGKKAAEEDAKTNTSTGNSRTRGGVSHDLNIRADFSYRMQNALNRNIQTLITTATNGSTAYKISIQADYTFSRLLTLSGFLDWQKNVPLVSATSYPTTTADFGISMKFSLTR
ncbi:MAG: cell surface protein SprA, partial [Bacteroidaceae bacterium]|nr:cell surface protein SprA [Bacteroidaceae bacterium]